LNVFNQLSIWLSFQLSIIFLVGIPVTLFFWSIKKRNKAVNKLLSIYWKISLLFFISLLLLIGKYNYALLITNISTFLITISIWFWNDINDELKEYDFFVKNLNEDQIIKLKPPVNIFTFIENLNVRFIQKKYQDQSNVNVKDFFLDINSRELKIQIKQEFKKIPKKIKLINCVGGGSSAYGFWSEFIDFDKSQIELIGVEAGGPKKSKLHAAPLSRNAKIGILHGAASYVCQNNEGQIHETESISAGLDYPGVSPIHCFLKDTKRARYTAASDEEALNAYKLVTKFEKLRPSLEPSHAFSVAIAEAKRFSKDTIVVVNSCGDAYKDRAIIERRLGKKYV